jgi:hypothetical protein
MRVLLLSLLVLFSASVLAQSCPEGQIFNSCDGPQTGPGQCIPGCVAVGVPPVVSEPIGPTELCISGACRPVGYLWIGNLVIAEAQLPNGYAVMGWSGPCGFADRSQCPDILNQAFNDLRTNALRANRAQGAR